MESSNIQLSEKPRKRKIKNTKLNLIEIAKVKGAGHVNHVGKYLPAKTVGKDCRYKIKH